MRVYKFTQMRFPSFDRGSGPRDVAFFAHVFESKTIYYVSVHDYFFGKVYCTVDEAFTSLDKHDFSWLQTVNANDIPGKVRVRLMQAVTDLREVR